MRTEDQMFVPGDWIIHDGPSAFGDRSFLHNAVRLVEETKTHYVIEHVIGWEFSTTTLWKGEWQEFTLASEHMKQAALQGLKQSDAK